MSVTFKDIDNYSQKSSVAGTEKLPVSDTQYITPDAILSGVFGTAVDTSSASTDRRYITTGGVWRQLTSTVAYSALVPVLANKTYYIQAGAIYSTSVAAMASASFGTNGSAAAFANGVTETTQVPAGKGVFIYTPADAVAMYIMTVNTDGNPCAPKMYDAQGGAISMLEDKQDKIDIVVGLNVDIIGDTDPNWNSGYALRWASGETATSASNSYSRAYFSIPESAHKLKYLTGSTTGTTAQNGICFYDSEKGYLSGVSYVTEQSESGAIENIVDIPPGAAFVRFTIYTTQIENFYARALRDDSDKILKVDDEGIVTPVTPSEIVKDSAISLQINGTTAGSFSTNESAAKTIDLGGNYAKYVLCADEASYTAIATKDSGTLYLIPESS